MSSNKRKYYEVTVTKIVHANNKGDALARAQSRPNIDGDVLATDVDGHRISATEAKSHLKALSA